jgi:hypothetical protein
VLVGSDVASAATKTWIGANGVWSASGNWSPAGAPASSDNARIAQGAFTLTYDAAAGVASLGTITIENGMTLSQAVAGSGIKTSGDATIGAAGAGTWNLAAGTIQTGQNLDLGTVGAAGAGTMIQSGGAVTVGATSLGTAYIGLDAGASGAYLLSGVGQLGTGATNVGSGGAGTFDQRDSSTHSTIALYVGVQAGSSGAYTLRGSASLATNILESIGDAGFGTFIQSGTSANLTRDFLRIGALSGARGSYTLSGGSLVINNAGHDGWLSVGESGTGTFDMSGGTVGITSAGSSTHPGSLFVGFASGSAGTLLLGGGTIATNSGTQIGIDGDGTVLHSGSGALVTPTLSLGEGFGSGFYDLSGGTLAVGLGEAIGNSGPGTFHQSAGKHSVGAGSLMIDNGSYRLSGGTLQVQGFAPIAGEWITSGGTFEQLGGYHSVTDPSGPGLLDDSTSPAGFLLSGGTLETSPSTVVANNGIGCFFEQNGGTHHPGSLIIAGVTGSSGTYTLGGSGVLRVDTDEIVGSRGHGTFIQSGGTNTVNSGFLRVGFNGASTGTFLLSGGTLIVNNTTFIGGAPGVFVQSGGLHQVGSLTVGFGTYTMNGGGTLSVGALTVGGFSTGTFNQTGASPRTTVAGSMLVTGTGVVNYNGGTLAAGALSVATGGRLSMSADGNRLLKVGAVSVASAGTIDLNDNDMQVTGGTGIAPVTALVAGARAGGAWTGSGITSSAARNKPDHTTTLGVLGGADFRQANGPSATFDGSPVADNDVLVKYTWYGDTDFNGRVNFDDYVRIDNGFNSHLTGWFNGDFDLNGQVNFDDYVMIDLAFSAQSGTLARAISFMDGSNPEAGTMSDPALRRVKDHVEQFGSDYAQQFLSAVPEPAILNFGGMVTSVTMLARRRARRSRMPRARTDCRDTDPARATRR